MVAKSDISKSDISKCRFHLKNRSFAFADAKELINSLKSSEHGDFGRASRFGQLTRYTFGNGATTDRTYSDNGSPATISVNRAGNSIMNHSYGFDGNYASSTTREDFSYDNLRRLTTERLYLGGTAYEAPAVAIRTNVETRSYDAWGRLRNPSTLVPFAHNAQPALLLRRGYTGHEHLPELGLVNMNARLYDPVIGRFLAPDPYVPDPTFSQDYNRYMYARNNPLIYTDPDGEFIRSFISGFVRGVVECRNPFKSGWQSVVGKPANQKKI